MNSFRNRFFSVQQNFISIILNLDLTQFNSFANFIILLMMNVFLLSNNSEIMCLAYVNAILHYHEISEANRFIHMLYQISIILSQYWFSSIFDVLIIQLFRKFITAAFTKLKWSWNFQTIAFVYEIIIFTCDSFFQKCLNENSKTMRC